jgi:hypothetical protein
VDTTILIDVLKDEFRPFQEKLYQAVAANEQLVSPAVVFGELMPQFQGDEKQVADLRWQNAMPFLPGTGAFTGNTSPHWSAMRIVSHDRLLLSDLQSPTSDL